MLVLGLGRLRSCIVLVATIAIEVGCCSAPRNMAATSSAPGSVPHPASSAPTAAVPIYADRDDDSILDLCDRCPDTAESFNGYQDEDGCPEKVVVVDNEDLVWDAIYFERNSALVRESQREVIAAQVGHLRRHLEVERVVCIGRAASDERDPANLALARAEALCAAYEQEGIDATRLVTRSMGPHSMPGERRDPDARRQAHARPEMVSGTRVARWNGRFLDGLAAPERIRPESPAPHRPERPGCPASRP